MVSEASLSWVDWVKGAEGRGCPVGPGISSSGNRVLAPLQVATEIWLQPCPAGGKGRLGSRKACDASGNQLTPKPQPSGTGPGSPFLTPQRALTTTPILPASRERCELRTLEKVIVGCSKVLVKSFLGPVSWQGAHRANTNFNCYPNFLHPGMRLST